MKTLSLFLVLLAVSLSLVPCGARDFSKEVLSPDGNISFQIFNQVHPDGGDLLCYAVKAYGMDAVLPSRLGFEMNGITYGRNLSLKKVESSEINEEYTLMAGKRIKTINRCNESVFTFAGKGGVKFKIAVRVFDDGAAFRYIIPGKGDAVMDTELTEFAIPDGKAWIHPYDWNGRLKPSYEQYCVCGKPVGTKSPHKKGWAFPMLFETGGLWTMVTEAYLDGSYPACHIDNSGNAGAYKIRFPEIEEPVIPDDPRPCSTLPWATPWRAIITGKGLDVIFATQMVQHLNPASKVGDTSWIKAGKSAWSWWYSGGSVRSYETQKAYVDLIDTMDWSYSLLDSGWQRMDGEGMEGVVRYANEKKRGIWLWYHSGAGREDGVMSDADKRRKEMERISSLGVRGIKVDFFDTDKQRIIKLYPAILEDAAEFHLMVDLHGATLPRGFERTYPNLMTTEAIRGAETLGRQERCDEAAKHNATVPFTRNVVGSMDYTPVTFSNKIRQGVVAYRKTSVAHQLALSVVFESGFQCLADRAEAYLSLPDEPRHFLSEVPVAWDESILLAGYPAEYAVIARRCGDNWFIGGINGSKEPRTVTFKLPEQLAGKTVRWIKDGATIDDFAYEDMTLGNEVSMSMIGEGGFAAAIH